MIGIYTSSMCKRVSGLYKFTAVTNASHAFLYVFNRQNSWTDGVVWLLPMRNRLLLWFLRGVLVLIKANIYICLYVYLAPENKKYWSGSIVVPMGSRNLHNLRFQNILIPALTWFILSKSLVRGVECFMEKKRLR